MNRMLGLLITLLLMVGTCFSQQLTMEIDSLVAETGTIVKVDFIIDSDVQNLRGYTLDLHYNPDVVDLFSIQEGPLFIVESPTFLWWTDDGLGVIEVDHAILGVEGSTAGPGVILSVFFTGLDCGIETLFIDQEEFRDELNNPLAISVGTLEHQICQVPHLDIEIQFPSNNALLTWNRVINSNWFIIYESGEPYGPWTFLDVTPDTFYLDTGFSIYDRHFYRITVDHD